MNARRAGGPFRSFEEFVRRTGLTSAVLQKLARVDAFRSLDLGRRPALWQSLPEQRVLPLWSQSEPDREDVPAHLPPMSPQEEVIADYQSFGMSLRAHPFKFLRAQLNELKITPAGRLPHVRNEKWLRVAGIVLLRQRPGSANGITFVTLEDETGMTNLIIRPEVWERYHRTARTASAMLVHGTLQREGEIIHVLAHRLEDLSPLLTGADFKARNFH